MPWSCPGCDKEVCERCFCRMGHCKACSEGRTDFELAVLANATGHFDFDLQPLQAGGSFSRESRSR